MTTDHVTDMGLCHRIITHIKNLEGFSEFFDERLFFAVSAGNLDTDKYMSIPSWRVAVIELGHGVVVEQLTEPQKAARLFRDSDRHNGLGELSQVCPFGDISEAIKVDVCA